MREIKFIEKITKQQFAFKDSDRKKFLKDREKAISNGIKKIDAMLCNIFSIKDLKFDRVIDAEADFISSVSYSDLEMGNIRYNEITSYEGIFAELIFIPNLVSYTLKSKKHE